MYQSSEQDSYSPFLTHATNRRASAPSIDNNHLDNTNYRYGTAPNPPVATVVPNTHARQGYDPRLPIASDIHLVPDSPQTRHPLPPKSPKHSACFLTLVVLLCTAAFVLEMYTNHWKFESFASNPMFGPSAGTLIVCGAKLDCLIEQQSEWWRVFSPMWLHAGVIHVVANMGATIQLGFPLERTYGWKAIAPLYMASGIIGTLCSILFLPNSIMVGASGAVFGLLGACWSEFFLNVNGRRTSRVFWSLFLITVLNLLLGTTPLLDNFAHTGGMLSGFLWGLFLLNANNGGGCGGFLSLAIALLVTMAAFVAVVAQVHLDEECEWCSYINCLPTPFWSCAIDAFYGPCAVSWRDEILNVTCAVGEPHFFNNITAVPDQASINKYCNASCGTICWDGRRGH